MGKRYKYLIPVWSEMKTSPYFLGSRFLLMSFSFSGDSSSSESSAIMTMVLYARPPLAITLRDDYVLHICRCVAIER